MGAELLPMVFTSGWASGINAYAVVALLGVLGRFGGVDVVPPTLQRTDVLVVAAALFCIELVADKVPFLDSAWDAVHTLIRPAVGAAVAALLAGDATTMEQALMATTGGVTALASHAVKAGLRLAVNSSPEPASNVVVSAGEDLTVAGVVALLVVQPWVAAGIAVTLLVSGAIIVVLLLGRIRRARRRWRSSGLWRSTRQ
jgi:hypothetical protein